VQVTLAVPILQAVIGPVRFDGEVAEAADIHVEYDVLLGVTLV